MSAQRIIRGVTALALILAWPAGVSGQSQATTGVIRGRAVDPAGAGVAGAVVTLVHAETGWSREVTTDGGGHFIVPLLPLGSYDVAVRAVGWQAVRRAGVLVRLGETVDLPVTLSGPITLDPVVIEPLERLIDPRESVTATRFPAGAVARLPNNGRNVFDLMTLAPHVAIVQGPDGDELTIAGQRGIHNNVVVDGADFNSPFYGEQRGGQRPPFTFNLDAVHEVVVAHGASAEFGRSGGGFVNVVTKSGTNEFTGSLHYYGKYDPLSATARHSDPIRGTLIRDPEFTQHQFGFTLGGPIVRDRAFFFVAYDHQLRDDTRQKDPNRIDPRLRAWVDTAFGGALAGDYGSIDRTDDARALLAKADVRLGRHIATLKYTHSWSEQVNGTFDVDSWLRSANAVERDISHGVSGSVSSALSSRLSNEFRFQWAREERPRAYRGPTLPGYPAPAGVTTPTGERPLPDIAMDFDNGYRLGLPFFIPVEYYDTRIQLMDNVSLAAGNHLIKFGAEFNRVNAVQTFVGFANGRFIFSSVDGFLGYAAAGPNYVECSDGSTSTSGSCPVGETIEGPVLLYLQDVGVGGRTIAEAGTQSIPQHDVGVFIQDAWRPHARLLINAGLRWEAQIQPRPIIPPDQVFFRQFIGSSVTTATGTYAFPSDGTVPSDWAMWQPRLGFAWDVPARRATVVRGGAGLYYPRVPGLSVVGGLTANGSIAQSIFRNSETGGLPPIDSLLPAPTGDPFAPDIYVFDRGFRNPRTLSVTLGAEREILDGLGLGLDYTYARTDRLTRFVNRNDPVFGEHPDGCIAPFVTAGPWCNGLDLDGDGAFDNGINTLTTVESTARSRYHGITLTVTARRAPFDGQLNYTLSWDRSDDDNERDPFTFRYLNADDFAPEYSASDRDQRHRVNAWLRYDGPLGLAITSRVSFRSAQPMSVTCGPDNQPSQVRVDGLTDPQRQCPDGSVVPRNTARKDNAFFSWDFRLARVFPVGGSLEVSLDVFNATNADNFLDPAVGSLLFNFDGTVEAGLGTPRQVQLGVRYRF